MSLREIAGPRRHVTDALRRPPYIYIYRTHSQRADAAERGLLGHLHMLQWLLAAARVLLARTPLPTQHTATRPPLGHATRCTAHEATAPAHDPRSEIDAGGFWRARPPRSTVALPGRTWRAWADVSYPSAVAAVAAGLT